MSGRANRSRPGKLSAAAAPATDSHSVRAAADKAQAKDAVAQVPADPSSKRRRTGEIKKERDPLSTTYGHT